MRVNDNVLPERVSIVSRNDARGTSISRVSAEILLLGAGWLAPFATSSAAKLAFVTSTSGNGILSTWSDAGGNGLTAGDAICVARATDGGDGGS